MVSKVLFIGNLNLRRSRFAEGFFNSMAREHGLSWKAISRGVSVYDTDERIDPELLPLLPDWGIEPHDSTASKLPLTVRDLMSARRIILWADCIEGLRAKFPSWCTKVEGWDTGSRELDSLPWIARCVQDLLDELAGRQLPRRGELIASAVPSAAEPEPDGADAVTGTDTLPEVAEVSDGDGEKVIGKKTPVDAGASEPTPGVAPVGDGQPRSVGSAMSTTSTAPVTSDDSITPTGVVPHKRFRHEAEEDSQADLFVDVDADEASAPPPAGPDEVPASEPRSAEEPVPLSRPVKAALRLRRG